MQMKYLSLAIAAAVATTGLTACGSDSHDYWTPPATGEQTPNTPGTEKPDAEKPDAEKPDAEKPDAEKPDAEKPDAEKPGTPGNDSAVGDNEDNVGAAAKDPNADVPTVGGQLYVRGKTSEFDRILNPKDADSSNATVLNSKSIQNKKLNNIVLGRETVDRKDNVRQSFLRYSGQAVAGFSDKQPEDTRELQDYNVMDNGVDVTSANEQQNGLVSVTRDRGVYTVVGQEDLKGKNLTYNVDGSTLSTRFFGNKYRDVTNAATVNSHRFNGTADAKGNLNITSLDADKFANTKLNHVQYGRVTSNIDKLPEALLQNGINYYEAQVVAKDPNNATNSVDTYFYRGLDETTIAQMDSLITQGGEYTYRGHALMYGIDNSFHGDLGSPDTNSFGGAALPVAGKGNYVEAVVNMGDRTVTGSVFNVWEVKPFDSETNVFTKDNLVSFNGQIFGNTAKGTAGRTYVKDGKHDAAFKGSFYGDKAQELGGSFNSVTEKYGASEWGGVFGAERDIAVPPVAVPDTGNANQTE